MNNQLSLAGIIVIAWLLIGVSIPGKAATLCQTCIGVIGDSLTYQGGTGAQKITNKLVAAGWAQANIKVDGVTGRAIANDLPDGKPGSITTIRKWRTAGFEPRVFVIALGTNNKGATAAAWTKEINKVLNEIGPGHKIYWVNLGFKDQFDPRVINFNNNLQTIANSRADLFPKDWNTHIHAFQQQPTLWLASDAQGIHMTTAGYDIRNNFYRDSVQLELSTIQP